MNIDIEKLRNELKNNIDEIIDSYISADNAVLEIPEQNVYMEFNINNHNYVAFTEDSEETEEMEMMFAKVDFIDGNKIVIGITARGKDADRFWFSLFHEIAHIVLGHIGQPNGTSIQDEYDADEWAKNVLIPSDKMQKFMNREDYSEYAIKSFAKEIEIAPGIIVGRLQNDGILKHNVLNSLKERYEIIA